MDFKFVIGLVIGFIVLAAAGAMIYKVGTGTDQTVTNAQKNNPVSPALFKCKAYCLEKCHSLGCVSAEDATHACTGPEFEGLEGDTTCSTILS